MAESRSASNDDKAPSKSSSSGAAPPDWEVLTMSMSGSALVKPQVNDLDNASAKSNPQIENSSNFDGETFASDVWLAPLHASVSLENSTDAEAEPFTEGWKPHLSSSGLYGCDGERNPHKDVSLQREGSETYLDSSNTALEVTVGCLFSEKDEGDEEKRVLAYDRSSDKLDVNDDLVKENFKTRGGKPCKKSSKVIWSFAVAASVVGIILLGHRLRAAYHQNQQLQLQLSAKDEKLNELLLQINRLKEVVGNPRRISVLKN